MTALDTPFSSYLTKQPEVDAAWHVCEARLSSLPAPLDELAARFLHTIASGTGSHRIYFSSPISPPLVYLPLWLGEGLGVPTSALLLAGTMQGYFYVRIQDDLLDDPASADPEMSLLGNACLAGMIHAFTQALGARASHFWPAFDRAFSDFSRLTLAEQRAVRSAAPYPAALFDEHAGKVAFARVPLLAVAALADRLDLEPAITTLVHDLGITYGLANDALGWPRDLRAGHRTHLLAEAGLTRADLEDIAAAEDEPAQEARREALAERLRGRLYEGGLLLRTIGRAIEVHRATASHAGLPLPGFDTFIAERIRWLEGFQAQVTRLSLGRALTRARAGS